jgi:hypothetical protein
MILPLLHFASVSCYQSSHNSLLMQAGQGAPGISLPNTLLIHAYGNCAIFVSLASELLIYLSKLRKGVVQNLGHL